MNCKEKMFMEGMVSKSSCDLVVYDRYIGRKSNEVDKRLLKIRLPSYIARQPRSINQQKFWKGIYCSDV